MSEVTTRPTSSATRAPVRDMAVPRCATASAEPGGAPFPAPGSASAGAGARRFGDRPQPSIRRISMDRDAVISQLEIARTAAYVLSVNFLGDGDFEEPSKAPGMQQLVQATSTALTAAEDLARQAGANASEIDLISQPRGWAEHMLGLIEAWRLDDAASFRFANQLVGRCFYSIEQLTERAYLTFTGAAE